MNTLRRALLLGVTLTAAGAFAQTVPLTQDSFMNPGVGTNFGTATTLNVGGAANSQALAQFDLGSLPSGVTASQVAKATFALFVNKLSAAGTINISVANGPWSELTVSGTAGPVASAAVASGISVTAAGNYIYVDATAAVQNWLNGSATNSGFIITSAGGGVNALFDSKESSTTSHPATLTIVLTNYGPTGATGATGSSGSIGATGSNGANGSTGATGATGTIGATGSNGANGSTGATGASGTIGATGSNGANGSTGATGATGTIGATGSNGANGSTGATGVTGSNGANGSTGATGVTGSNGANGSTGATGVTGSNGANGSTGATGVTGFNGANGSTGATGATGFNGTNGSTGATGATGFNGTIGPAGATGATGPAVSANAPSGIPFTVVGHNSGTANWAPGDTNQNSSIVPTVMSISTTACKPAMTIYSFMNAATTFTLNSASFASGSLQGSAGSTIISCAASAYSSGGPNTCSAVAASNTVAATPLYITFSGGAGSAFVAFSCQ